MPVMRHQHDGAFVGLQRFGQGLARIQIEVVGRLIQQQQIGLAPGDQCQRQTRLLATGKALAAGRGHVAGKAKAAQEIA